MITSDSMCKKTFLLLERSMPDHKVAEKDLPGDLLP